jgi:hypothetical protein
MIRPSFRLRVGAAAVLGISLVLIQCGKGPGGLVKKAYPEGFSLRHPPDWEARVLDKGLILVSARDVSRDPAFIAVYPFILKSAATSRSWLEQNLGTLGGLFTRCHLDQTRQLRPVPDETAARLHFAHEGAPCEGTALCSIFGKSGVLYVMAAREGEFEARKPRLLESLRSFRFGLPDTSVRPEPAKPNIQYVSWQDPVEQAFSVEVPAGWQVQGGTQRRASVDLVHVLHAVSPDQKTRILFNDPNIPIFVIPNQMLLWGGFREGSWYSPGYGVRMMVMGFRSGLAFILEYLQKNFAPRLTSFEIVDRKERPDIVADFNRIYSASRASGISFQLYAGDAAFRYSQDGEPGIGYGLAVTQAVQSAAMGGGNWSVALLLITTCPESEAETVRETATHMFQSVRMNPQWVAGQQQLAGDVSRIVTETNQAISGIINDSYWTRQGVLDDVHRKFSNAVLGVTDLVDPETGDVYKVEAGHNFYWVRSGTSHVVGTETYTRPDIDFSPLAEF